MTEIELIKWYIEQRIRIDGMQEGFTKAYETGRIIQQNTKVLTAVCRMEVDLSNSINNKLNKTPVMPTVCDCPEAQRMHLMDNEPDECTICGKKFYAR